MKCFSVLVLACVLGAMSGCDKGKEANAKKGAGPGDSPAPSADKFDACSLLTNQEIEAVEGSPVNNTKPSANANGGLRFAQCFYTTAEFSRSVSLAVTLSDSSKGSGRSVRQFWEDTFGKYEKEKKPADPDADKEKRESLREQKREGEENEGTPPKKISGVGDDAYWAGNRVGGALYVLKKEVLIRISVGGPDPEQGKIDKCKALAEKALKRL
jgi:hypothetical protein